MYKNQEVRELISKLLEIMARLRDPHDGCPWDVEQDFRSIAPYTIEEAYEVADAIERGALDELPDELGDLLLQVVFHAQMGAEQGVFDFADVTRAICDKLIRRHPHVFGEATVESAAAQTEAWEAHKARERAERGVTGGRSVLDDLPRGLPALARAVKLGRRASSVGFDWPDAGGVRAKLHEELDELEEELDRRGGADRVAHELGDLLFAVANLARHLGLDPDGALRASNLRFERRFHYIEARLAASGRTPAEADPAELEALWQEAKAAV